MPQGGVSARAARRSAAPWWEELDSEAFREFPTARRERITTPAALDESPVVAGPVSSPPVASRPVGSPPVGSRPVSSRPVGSPPVGSRPAGSRPVASAPVATMGQRRDGAGGGGQGIEGRRTVTIRGRGAERNLPMARPTLRRHERPGYRPDRTALWAVALGVLLILVAAASAHAAVLSHLAH